MPESRKKKLYQSISEVSELLGVKPHVLRYWESQFRTLKPKKNRAGNRMYRERDLELLQRIKELLYDRRYTIAGAKRELQQTRVQLTDAEVLAADARAEAPEVSGRHETPADAVVKESPPASKTDAPAQLEMESLRPLDRDEKIAEIREEIAGLLDWLESKG